MGLRTFIYPPSPCSKLYLLPVSENLCTVMIGTLEWCNPPTIPLQNGICKNWQAKWWEDTWISKYWLYWQGNEANEALSRTKSLRQPHCNWDLVQNTMLIIILVLGLNKMTIFYPRIQSFLLFIWVSGSGIFFNVFFHHFPCMNQGWSRLYCYIFYYFEG